MGVWPKIKKEIGAQMTPPIMNIISDPPQEGFGTGPGLTFLIKLGLFLLFLEFKGGVVPALLNIPVCGHLVQLLQNGVGYALLGIFVLTAPLSEHEGVTFSVSAKIGDFFFFFSANISVSLSPETDQSSGNIFHIETTTHQE